MTRTIRIAAAAAIALLAAPVAAQASDDHCTSTPRSAWRSMDDVTAAAKALGYDVARVDIEGSCYEAYARDKDGRRLEVYFDPDSLKVVRMKDKTR